jgi:hypothetical protein
MLAPVSQSLDETQMLSAIAPLGNVFCSGAHLAIR